ncbi:TenA family transcriptional regulator [Spartinivicinus ruber]|uniref:TenA family transcriptional regulator n=1 Tax=Spartinivicinus ruber TaxID=2683272 RepID=UPI0013D0DA4B|nr:iron-containing redox enzyme family protein [Spartinivicinus ruber]
MGFYAQLQDATEAARQHMLSAPVFSAAPSGNVLLETYTYFLSQAYHHVKHTVPLLMACGAKLGPRYPELQQAIAEYIEEEIGHQEWILSDIAACGKPTEFIRNGEPDAPIELMVAFLYDAIQRGNPHSLFGMVQVLEGTSINKANDMADAFQTALGLPDQAFSYLRSHGKLDEDHWKFFTSLMNKITDPVDQKAIMHSAVRVYQLYGQMLYSLPLSSVNTTSNEPFALVS